MVNEWTCEFESGGQVLRLDMNDEDGHAWSLFYRNEQLQQGEILRLHHIAPGFKVEPDYPGDYNGELKTMWEKADKVLTDHFLPNVRRAA